MQKFAVTPGPSRHTLQQPAGPSRPGGLASSFSQTLSAELEGTGVRVHVVCPGVVAIEPHTRQGMDLSAVPQMTAEDFVIGALRGLELGEVLSAPGVEDYDLLTTVFQSDLATFAGQSPRLARATVPARNSVQGEPGVPIEPKRGPRHGHRGGPASRTHARLTVRPQPAPSRRYVGPRAVPQIARPNPTRNLRRSGRGG